MQVIHLLLSKTILGKVKASNKTRWNYPSVDEKIIISLKAPVFVFIVA